MTIVQGHKQNFDSLMRAFRNGDVCLMECKRKSDGEVLAVICATTFDEDGTMTATPFAAFFNGDPYEMLSPPMPEGGFEE